MYTVNVVIHPNKVILNQLTTNILRMNHCLLIDMVPILKNKPTGKLNQLQTGLKYKHTLTIFEKVAIVIGVGIWIKFFV